MATFLLELFNMLDISSFEENYEIKKKKITLQEATTTVYFTFYPQWQMTGHIYFESCDDTLNHNNFAQQNQFFY